ncbi:peptidyl-tRNA hydrolase PTH2-domain-containing protein [Favolaschia claudopus]|uniref:peptidyl-tRNA hydrolase n=1 Tax=Favolaschia claudopus TaxID=2862362 RepID=A0AAW0EHH0_9AGAR
MALVAGYCLVVAASISLGYYTASSGAGVKSTSRTTVDRPPPRQRSEEDSDSESEQGDVSSLTTLDDCTLVLCVRTDLSMSTGKIAAQCSHATLACYKTLLSKNPVLLRKWARAGYLKSVVRCSDEDALLLLQAQAQSLNLCARSIQDAGRTQIAAGSTTVLGIAGPTVLVRQVTEELLAY